MYKKLPCINCPVLAMCVGQRVIKCKLLLNFLTNYYKDSKYPHWPRMLTLLRKTLRGNWCTVGYNDRITKVEKDRKGLISWGVHV